MITHFDMSSGEIIESQDRDPAEPAPLAAQAPLTRLRLMTVDEAIAEDRRHRPGLPPDVARVPAAIWLRRWR